MRVGFFSSSSYSYPSSLSPFHIGLGVCSLSVPLPFSALKFEALAL